MRKLLLIINPVAGRGVYRQGLGDALHVLYSGGFEPTLMFTTHGGEAVRLAADNGADYDIVCCLGGDGTLSEVVTGLMLVPNPPPIGYFPLGSTNDVANTLKLPKNDSVACARIIVSGEPKEWDVGALGDHDFFTYVAAFGAFTDVSYETTQQSKQALGHLAYLLEGVNRLPRLPHYQTRVEFDDGQVKEGDFIFGGVTNSTSVGGLVKLDENVVSLDDGKFELTLVRYPATLMDINTLVSEVTSMTRDGEFLTITQTSRARFTFDRPVPWTRDGENGGIYSDVWVENRSRAVRIIV